MTTTDAADTPSVFIRQNELPPPFCDFTPEHLTTLYKRGQWVKPLRLTPRSGFVFLRRDVAAFIERLEHEVSDA